jgi:hypothetical protein
LKTSSKFPSGSREVAWPTAQRAFSLSHLSERSPRTTSAKTLLSGKDFLLAAVSSYFAHPRTRVECLNLVLSPCVAISSRSTSTFRFSKSQIQLSNSSLESGDQTGAPTKSAKFPSDSFREGAPPAFPGIAITFLRSVGKKVGRAQGDCCILSESGRPKWKSRERTLLRAQHLLIALGASAATRPLPLLVAP